MNDEIGPLTITRCRTLNAGRVPISTKSPPYRPPTSGYGASSYSNRTRVVSASKAPARRYEGERDPLDTFIAKAEELRPVCPVPAVEDMWNKITTFVVDVTPVIPILPAQVVLKR